MQHINIFDQSIEIFVNIYGGVVHESARIKLVSYKPRGIEGSHRTVNGQSEINEFVFEGRVGLIFLVIL